MSSWKEFSKSIELSREYHERYHRAIANPIRREILKLIRRGLGEDEIAKYLKISLPELEYHIQVLIRGFCVERRGGELRLTKEGEVVDHI
ncbi:MAG: winged helix-turn-helix domain-containing protein [Archaeoglobaceae archaeon]